MVSFENFVKSMPPSLSELKVTPSFCFPCKIPDDPTASTIQACNYKDKFVFKKPSSSISSLNKNKTSYQIFSLKLHNSKILRHTGSVYSVNGTCYSGAVDRRVYVSVHILLCEKLNGRFSHDYLPKSKKPSFNAYVALKNKKTLHHKSDLNK